MQALTTAAVGVAALGVIATTFSWHICIGIIAILIASLAGWRYFELRPIPHRAVHDPRPSSFAAATNEVLQKSSPPSAVAVAYGDGIGVFAKRAIAAGEAILVERPLLLTVAPSARMTTCAVCLADSRKGKHGRAAWEMRCDSCGVHYYCSKTCAATARPSHDGIECEALSRFVREHSAGEETHQHFDMVARAVRLLADRANRRTVHVGAAGLLGVHTGAMDRLMSVSPANRRERKARARVAEIALSVVPEAARLPPDELIRLLEAEVCNSVGVLGHVRGEDIASACFAGFVHLLNHACRPCAVLDSVTRPEEAGGARENATATPAFAIRALEDIPMGAEITLMYAFEEPSHLLHDYGFECHCKRCKERGEEGADRLFWAWKERVCCPAGPQGGCGCGIGVPIDSHKKDGVRRRCANCAHTWWAAS